MAGRRRGGEETCQEVGGLLSRVQVRAVQVDLQSPCRAARAVPLLQSIRVTGSQGAEDTGEELGGCGDSSHVMGMAAAFSA